MLWISDELGFYICDLTRDQRMMLHPRSFFQQLFHALFIVTYMHSTFLYSSQPPHFALTLGICRGDGRCDSYTHHITWSSLILLHKERRLFLFRMARSWPFVHYFIFLRHAPSLSLSLSLILMEK